MRAKLLLSLFSKALKNFVGYFFLVLAWFLVWLILALDFFSQGHLAEQVFSLCWNNRRGQYRTPFSLSYRLYWLHDEDAKQDEDRRTNIQERITMRHSKDDPGKHGCQRLRKCAGDIDDAKILAPALGRR